MVNDLSEMNKEIFSLSPVAEKQKENVIHKSTIEATSFFIKSSEILLFENKCRKTLLINNKQANEPVNLTTRLNGGGLVPTSDLKRMLCYFSKST